MISVYNARAHIRENTPGPIPIKVSLEKSLGSRLAGQVIADRPYPPFHRVAMDGIAISSQALLAGQREFAIQEVQAAGQPPVDLKNNRDCIEIMTGAALGQGVDQVIPYEEIEIINGRAQLLGEVSAKDFKNVHPEGSDYTKDKVLLDTGCLIRAHEITVAASVGMTEVPVYKKPIVGIVSTGDELVEPGAPIERHQIRSSNRLSLRALLQEHGFEQIELAHLPDDPKKLVRGLESIFDRVDYLILSGGVSRGKFDYVPSALQDLQVKEIFHRVAQRPGKPLWFGKRDQKLVFGLPGNPVSVLACLRQYVIPSLQLTSGSPQVTSSFAVRLADDFEFCPKLTLFKPAKFFIDDDGIAKAQPIAMNGSGDFASLTKSDGMIEFDFDRDKFSKDQIMQFHPWGPLHER